MKYDSPLIDEHGIFQRRPAKLIELAQVYRMQIDTFRRLLKKHKHSIGEKEGHYFTCKQVKKITEIIGLPDNLDLEKDLK